ncbi:MAG TPA: glycoside hydrolase family 5 protein, partial [Candidatus Acidoferrales bacterium]|nr:glycoside hydrolase family 5 protein [Candidatus Acidoferrales bacterium]
MNLSFRCALIALTVGLSVAISTPADVKRPSLGWRKEAVELPAYENPASKQLPRIVVSGNRFVYTGGKPVLFRGLNIADPNKVERDGHWSRDYFVRVKEMGANLVRIPVHPVSWRERSPAAELALLDQAVDWCTELGMYVIIDWHSIGDLNSGVFQEPMYETSVAETFAFWRVISRHYAGTNTVAFYELFNEPTTFGTRLTRASWKRWKVLNERVIAAIRESDKQTIPLVAGFNWAFDLTPLQISPIAAPNIGYVAHPYPHKSPKPWERAWDANFGFAASRYPVIATEIGFTLGNQGIEDNREYGEAIVHFLESRGISWTAWIFDPEWTPKMITSWQTYELTDSGEFFKKAMQANMAQDPT